MVVGQTVQNLITAAIGLLILAGIMVGVTAFGASQTAGSAARNLTGNIGAMANNFGDQLDTVGTMFGVGLIIAAIAVLGVGLMKRT